MKGVASLPWKSANVCQELPGPGYESESEVSNNIKKIEPHKRTISCTSLSQLNV